jgi:chromate transport protein ChrA
MQTNLLHDLATYLIVGLIWGAIIEYIESKQTNRQIPKTLIAQVVVILTWPITVFVMLLGMIRNLLTGK